MSRENIESAARPPGIPATVFSLWANPVFAALLIALWIVLAIVFNGEPWVDKSVSAFFFTARPCGLAAGSLVCGSFTVGHDWGLSELRQGLQILPVAVAIVVAATLARDLAAGLRWKDATVRFQAAALGALALGPGLVVNVVLKEHWGRPRPYSTDLFGGKLPFVPAGQLSNYCHSNCSFVSGEASSIFWLLCLLPLLPAAWRPRAGIVAAGLAVLTSGLRVAFGGHYLSDVVLGGLSTLVVFSCVCVVIEYLAERKGYV